MIRWVPLCIGLRRTSSAFAVAPLSRRSNRQGPRLVLAMAAGSDAKSKYVECIGRSLGVSSATVAAVEDRWLIRVERAVPYVDEDRIDKYVETYLASRSSVLAVGRELLASKAMNFVSPSGAIRVVFFPEEDDAPRFEIWSHGTRRVRGRAPHGSVIKPDTPMVGGSSWSSDESHLAYVADSVRPPRKKPDWGSSDFEYRLDYGEKMVDIVNPSVFSIDISTGDIVCALAEPSGQPEYCNDELAAIKLTESKRKLGLTYCFNRPSSVMLGDKTMSSTSLARSPRFEQSTGTLAWLCGDFVTHDGPVGVELSTGVRCGRFYGAPTLPRDCWKYREGCVVLNALDGAEPAIAIVEDGEARWLRKQETLLAACRGALLTHRRRGPHDPGVISLVLDNDGQCLDLPIGPTFFESSLPELKTFDIADRAFLLSAPDARRLVVVPHGGPHSCSTKTYVPSLAFLAVHGYACLLVNYRGSIGFGDETDLPGRIGDLDVADCVAATKAALQSQPQLDPSCVAVCGGSHGGFLAASLIARHADLFKVAVIRNPVVNLLSMIATTDIPDWCRVEAFDDRSPAGDYAPLTDDQLHTLRDLSPITYVHGVRAPTLLGLGLKDRRVPPSQGLQFYHALPSDTPKRLLCYPDDDHAIDNPKSAADFWLNALAWLDAHLVTDATPPSS